MGRYRNGSESTARYGVLAVSSWYSSGHRPAIMAPVAITAPPLAQAGTARPLPHGELQPFRGRRDVVAGAQRDPHARAGQHADPAPATPGSTCTAARASRAGSHPGATHSGGWSRIRAANRATTPVTGPSHADADSRSNSTAIVILANRSNPAPSADRHPATALAKPLSAARSAAPGSTGPPAGTASAATARAVGRKRRNTTPCAAATARGEPPARARASITHTSPASRVRVVDRLVPVPAAVTGSRQLPAPPLGRDGPHRDSHSHRVPTENPKSSAASRWCPPLPFRGERVRPSVSPFVATCHDSSCLSHRNRPRNGD